MQCSTAIQMNTSINTFPSIEHCSKDCEINAASKLFTKSNSVDTNLKWFATDVRTPFFLATDRFE